MKKIFLIAVISSISLIGCTEVNDLIQLYPAQSDQLAIDTAHYQAVNPQSKNVLLEDYTGDKCDNCPNAQNLSIEIQNAYPNRVCIIAIHCTPLAAPWPGFPDYRTKYGDQLVDYFFGISGPSSLPTGDIDRKIYGGSFGQSYATWPGTVGTELALSSSAAIAFNNKQYDAASRTVSMDITTTFTQSSKDTFYVSAALIESGFKGEQEFPTTYDTNFVFEHVLRKLMLPYNGLHISNGPSAGSTYNVNFSTIIDPKWNADSCKIVALVHRRSPASNAVEQVQETTIK